ncbi:hypothetical protein EOD43_21960 [Sphingomonas crocodyli]|uniref:Porin n=1 Tax=Sphingomonas crocodyli TaxID=1979270 RepID=A0A437LVN1_9SPHN|nr:hypothetical protein EOD43_21960 [Sphingomonas crocodyli]
MPLGSQCRGRTPRGRARQDGRQRQAHHRPASGQLQDGRQACRDRSRRAFRRDQRPCSSGCRSRSPGADRRYRGGARSGDELILLRRAFPFFALAAFAAPAAASGISGGVEVASDYRVRGLSWSDGRPAVTANVGVSLTDAIDFGVTAASLRGSVRHGGADALIRPSLRYFRNAGAVQFGGGVTGYIFPDHSNLGFVEGQALVGTLIGPAQLWLVADYAPRQDAIGGDNLRIAGQADVAVPMTPFTVSGSIGRSSGSVRDAVFARRLRPDGSYWDWRLGVDHVTGPLRLGIAYTGTDIGRTAPGRFVDRDTGHRVTVSAGLSF